jgi:hypothetical protein
VEILLKEYIRDFCDLVHRAWKASPDQTVDLMGIVAGEVLKWVILFLLARYLYEKFIKRK